MGNTKEPHIELKYQVYKEILETRGGDFLPPNLFPSTTCFSRCKAYMTGRQHLTAEASLTSRHSAQRELLKSTQMQTNKFLKGILKGQNPILRTVQGAFWIFGSTVRWIGSTAVKRRPKGNNEMANTNYRVSSCLAYKSFVSLMDYSD